MPAVLRHPVFRGRRFALLDGRAAEAAAGTEPSIPTPT
jgi:hypothetical protein